MKKRSQPKVLIISLATFGLIIPGILLPFFVNWYVEGMYRRTDVAIAPDNPAVVVVLAYTLMSFLPAIVLIMVGIAVLFCAFVERAESEESATAR